MGQLNTIYFSLRKSKLNKVAVYFYVGQSDSFFLRKRSVRGQSAPHPIYRKRGSRLQGHRLSLFSSNPMPWFPPLEPPGCEVITEASKPTDFQSLEISKTFDLFRLPQNKRCIGLAWGEALQLSPPSPFHLWLGQSRLKALEKLVDIVAVTAHFLD